MTDDPSCRRIEIGRYSRESRLAAVSDEVAVEEPLEVRLAYGPPEDRRDAVISLTMRTPGQDVELAAGFLFTEGIVRSEGEIEQIRPVGLDSNPGETQNAVRVDLKPEIVVDLARLQRHFYTSSSCGVCGKTSIEAVRVLAPGNALAGGLKVAADTICRLPEQLQIAQATFQRTGGLHASALFDSGGALLALREDVGRHNALDKLIGAEVMRGRIPLDDWVLLVSGRASFELAQKAVMAGIPILAAVGAPSSLAVELATEFGLTLLGFVRRERFNIYSGAERILS